MFTLKIRNQLEPVSIAVDVGLNMAVVVY